MYREAARIVHRRLFTFRVHSNSNVHKTAECLNNKGLFVQVTGKLRSPEVTRSISYCTSKVEAANDVHAPVDTAYGKVSIKSDTVIAQSI